MRKKIYITGIENKPGKSFVSMVMCSILKQHYPHFHCYKLFNEKDEDEFALLRNITQSPLKPIMGINQAMSMMRSVPDDLFSRVIESLSHQEEEGIQFFEGSDFDSDNDVFEYQFNLSMAYQLNCDVILVISAKDRTLDHTLNVLGTAIEIAQNAHASIVGIVVNQVPYTAEIQANTLFKKQFKNIPLILILPEFEQLAHPSMAEIADKLQARVLYGEKELYRQVREYTVAAKTVGNFLQSRLDREGMLIITPDDRIDILLGALLADQSANYPKIAGLVLTGGVLPGSIIQLILAGLEQTFPILLTHLKTFETATTLFTARFSINSHQTEKINDAIESVRPYMTEPLLKLISGRQEKPLFSPAMFLYQLQNKAKSKLKQIILPEGEEPRILMAADYLLTRKITGITLIGNREKIMHLAKRLNLLLPQVTIISMDNAPDKERYAQQYFELRKHKNVNFPIALERMEDPNYYGAMMVYNGQADGMVSGSIHTTADTVRPALEIIKTKPQVQRVSSVFIMCLSTKVLIYGDCAINPEPDSFTLAEIAGQAALMAKKLGLIPKVALLSYSTGESGKGESVEKVAQALKLLQQKNPNYIVEGPVQYDAAIDPAVAAQKMPGSALAGQANVLIFPDLNTGNNTYKAVQRETGALAIGPVLLGLNKPVNDLSRGCTPQDIINTIVITALQAQGD